MNKGCPKCGRTVERTLDVCSYCGYKFAEIEKVYKMAINGEVKKINENASIIQRLAAFNFDMLIMMLIFLSLYFLNPLEKYIDFININIVYGIIVLIIYFIYSTILDATPLKGTFGTRVLNIQVVDEAGYQIGFSMAFKHNILKIFNILTIGIGYIALIFTKHKQTIADYLGDVYVENRNLEYNTKLYYANLFLRLFAFVIDLLILALVYFVIVFIESYLLENGILISTNIINLIVVIIMAITAIFYFAVSDGRGGSIGKQLFSFDVTNLNGKHIGFLKAFIRVLLMIFELLFLPLGLLICLVYPTKQTFKDLVTKTVVIKKVLYK